MLILAYLGKGLIMNTFTATAATTATTSQDQGAETAGQFFPYTPAVGLPTPPAGYRSVAICYKQTAAMKKAGKAARDNVYVTVPSRHISTTEIIANIETLAPFISQYLASVEDEAIRADHKAGVTQLFTDTLTLEKIVSQLEESGSTGLDGETITKWFTDACAVQLLSVLALKLGVEDPSQLTEAQSSKVSQVIQSYLDLFISLASGKTMLSEAQRTQLTKCLDITGATDTALGHRFIARFTKMAEKEQAALESLGDLDL